MAKYNIEWLLKEVSTQKRIKYVFFWGHQAQKDGQIGASCLSQWFDSPASFVVDGINYQTAEHWMMVEKARLFNDEEMVERILNSSSAAKAKKLGRLVHNFDAKVWDQHAFDIVKQGSIYKFGQNPQLKEYLLQTGSRVLVEASPLDAIWGIGLSREHEHACQPSFWRGKNLLGFALMEARDVLLKAG
ncbi:NADAR family protein [Aureispira anguillae]|uniref:NADAR family protein n=1 Tax=Aureispira anguillae TaxID=2864201 RepID=A0A916DQP9_9BACT|nr:NADAR family protein [Aureispira anguillae]BDS10210.1 NADAR family protein [Aureispira anguillae]